MVTQSKPSFYFVGGGRSGAGLCHYLLNRGFPITGLVEIDHLRFSFLKEKLSWPFLRQEVNPDDLQKARLVLLTVPDDKIAGLAEKLSRLPLDWGDKIAAHTSGVLPSRILAPLRQEGAAVASVHPVISFSYDPRQNDELLRCWFNLEGDEPALTLFESVFQLTGNPNFRIEPNQKPALHLAGVFYANFYVALASAVEELLEGLFPPDRQVFSVLKPLLASSMNQVRQKGASSALTGPVKRGDTTTVRAHLEFLKMKYPELVDIYRILSRRLLALSDLPESKRKQLLQLLKDFQ